MNIRLRKKIANGREYCSTVTSKRIPGKKNPQEVVLEYIWSYEKLSAIVLADYEHRMNEADAQNYSDNMNPTEAGSPADDFNP